MTDQKSDSISFDDLFEALGDTPRKPAKSSKAEQDSQNDPLESLLDLVGDNASADRAAKKPKPEPEEELDLFSALGIDTSPKKEPKKKASSEETARRDAAREEQLREQQIRSQQWQRELELKQERERQAEIAARAEAEAAAAEAAMRRQQEEAAAAAAAAAQPVAAAETAEPQQPDRFPQDETQITPPAFLDKKPISEVLSQSASIGQIKPVSEAAQSEQDAATESVQTTAETIQVQEAIQPEVPAANVQQTAQEQPVQAQAAQEQAAASEPQPEEAHEARTIPVTPAAELAQTVAVSEQRAAETASESAAAETRDLGGKIAPQSEQPATEPETAPERVESDSRTRSVIKPLGASQEKRPSVQDKQPRQRERSSVAESAPRPSVASASVASPEPQRTSREVQSGPYEKETRASSRGNIIGVILIIIAIVCAVLTILIFTGAMNPSMLSANSSSSVANSASTAPAASSAASASISETESKAGQAVYSYVVRGVDGQTHDAKETATFGEDGNLVESRLEISAPDKDTAVKLLDQLKEEFGDSLTNSATSDQGVTIVVNVMGSDLDKDAYTELLSSSMTDFKVVSS